MKTVIISAILVLLGFHLLPNKSEPISPEQARIARKMQCLADVVPHATRSVTNQAELERAKFNVSVICNEPVEYVASMQRQPLAKPANLQ